MVVPLFLLRRQLFYTNLYKFCEHRQITGGTEGVGRRRRPHEGHCGVWPGVQEVRGGCGTAENRRPRSKRIQFGVVMRVLAVFYRPHPPLTATSPLSAAPVPKISSTVLATGRLVFQRLTRISVCVIRVSAYTYRFDPLPHSGAASRWYDGKCLFS